MSSFGIFFFHGNPSCAPCLACLGYYAHEPGRPHPNCDCPITPESVPEYDYAEIVHNNPSVTTSTDSETRKIHSITNQHQEKTVFIVDLSAKFEGERNLNTTLEEHFSSEIAANYKDSLEESDTMTVTLQPGATAEFYAICDYKEYELSLEQYYELKSPSANIDVYLKDIEGSFESPVKITFMIVTGG